MNDKQRLQLQNMIKVNNVEDQTELIRELKHSIILKNEINNMMMLKVKYRNDENQMFEECVKECNFLYTYYTDIFNKIKKNEIDIRILNQFLDVLEKIENGELDQHEGSFLVGTILKELYIDSALKKSEKLDKLSETNNPQPVPVEKEKKNISWKQFKASI